MDSNFNEGNNYGDFRDFIRKAFGMVNPKRLENIYLCDLSSEEMKSLVDLRKRAEEVQERRDALERAALRMYHESALLEIDMVDWTMGVRKTHGIPESDYPNIVVGEDMTRLFQVVDVTNGLPPISDVNQ